MAVLINSLVYLQLIAEAVGALTLQCLSFVVAVGRLPEHLNQLIIFQYDVPN